jgi:tRNA A37 methylthiotransferase MiaB
MQVRLETLGCRLNISEIEGLARGFIAAGHGMVGPGETADVRPMCAC